MPEILCGISKTLKSISNESATREQIELRFERNHRDSAFLDLNDGYFIGLRKADKKESLYYYKEDRLSKAFEIPYRISSVQKATNADQTLIRIMNVSTYPDLWLLPDYNYDNAKRISVANPQQSTYNWATVETVKWTAYDGQQLEGLLYKPENYDPSKKYPLLFYYYELNSDNLHITKRPSLRRASLIQLNTQAVVTSYLFRTSATNLASQRKVPITPL